MTPWDLAKVGAESSHQRALFAFCNMAERWGFAAAWDTRAYTKDGMETLNASVAEGQIYWEAVPELHWLHAIPNGEKREMITAANLKAAGVKKGVLDVFLPLPMFRDGYGHVAPYERPTAHHGLYVELKRPGTTKTGTRKKVIVDQSAGALSPEQDAFVAYALNVNYAVYLAFTWDQAAHGIQSYIEACRKNA